MIASEQLHADYIHIYIHTYTHGYIHTHKIYSMVYSEVHLFHAWISLLINLASWYNITSLLYLDNWRDSIIVIDEQVKPDDNLNQSHLFQWINSKCDKLTHYDL